MGCAGGVQKEAGEMNETQLFFGALVIFILLSAWLAPAFERILAKRK